MPVLIVEDDRKTASFTSRRLREERFVVDVAEETIRLQSLNIERHNSYGHS